MSGKIALLNIEMFFGQSFIPSFLEQVRPHHQKAPLQALWTAAVLQVFLQGDADHEIQPQQARQALRRLLRSADLGGGRRRESFLRKFYSL